MHKHGLSWFVRENDHRYCGGERALNEERGERERSTQGIRASPKENTSPNPLIWKMRGADFCEYLQLAELKNWSLEIQGMAGLKP